VAAANAQDPPIWTMANSAGTAKSGTLGQEADSLGPPGGWLTSASFRPRFPTLTTLRVVCQGLARAERRPGGEDPNQKSG